MDPYDHDLERGLRNRRAILGDPWVDKSIAGANAFNAEFQNFISRYAWHEILGAGRGSMRRPAASSCWRSPARSAAGRSSSYTCTPRWSAARRPA